MRGHSKKASVVLVALSCVTVLGIAMASFLAVTNQAMRLSNRDYAKVVSKQLAEMGLERALRSYNANPNTFTSPSWTLSGITATRPLTGLPTYGNSGITPSVKIRVDHYLDTKKATVWSVLTTYARDDFVYYQGVWYLCVVAAASTTTLPPSDTSAWTAAPESWNPYANYYPGNIVLFGGSAYQCKTGQANINQTPPNTTYWTSSSVAAWSASTPYKATPTLPATASVVYSGGVPYRCIQDNTGQTPPNTTYWLSAPVIYAEGTATLPDSSSTTIKTQLRATLAPAPLFPNALGATAQVIFGSSGVADSYNSPLTAAWSSTTTYLAGTVVRSGTTVYRCIATSTNNVPPNATYWAASTLPVGYSAVVAGGGVGVSSSTNTVQLNSNFVVGGYLAAPSLSTSPYGPRVIFAMGANLKNADGTVISPWPSAASVDQTRISRSPNVPQFDIQTVTGGGNIPASGNMLLPDNATTLGTPGATTPSIYNITDTYDAGTSQTRSGLYLEDSTDVLTIDGPVILNVTGPLYINRGLITITSTGSLEVYFTGQLWVGSSSANVGIRNQTLDPKKCLLVSTYNGNTAGANYFWSVEPFHGLIYMPNAYVRTWNNVVIYGAISASNIGFPNAGCVFHYDTSLRTAGKIGTFLDGPYGISEWRELTDPTERVTL